MDESEFNKYIGDCWLVNKYGGLNQIQYELDDLLILVNCLQKELAKDAIDLNKVREIYYLISVKSIQKVVI